MGLAPCAAQNSARLFAATVAGFSAFYFLEESDLSQSRKGHGGKKGGPDYQWIVMIFAMTMVISAVMSFASSQLLDGAGMALSFIILICIVLIGIIFDVIGVAVTTADETPFHAMASRKVPEARDALRLIRNANRVSSFCNDVIGDICGVISGSASAVIAARVGGTQMIVDLLMSAFVAALTVGGKAFGKTFAISESTRIVQMTARVLCFFRKIPALFRKRRKKR